MAWNPSVLFAAFKAAGMLKQARHRPDSATPADFDCEVKQPDLMLLADQHQASEFVIEYETAAAPRIRLGDELLVDGTLYRARAHPYAVGDGYYSQCQLEPAA